MVLGIELVLRCSDQFCIGTFVAVYLFFVSCECSCVSIYDYYLSICGWFWGQISFFQQITIVDGS
jgi:hypothetical protein